MPDGLDGFINNVRFVDPGNFVIELLLLII